MTAKFQHARGFALGSLLQSVLLLAVLGQIVYLAANWRVRIDTTAERVYTLSESTRRVLDGLGDRLLIEAYFSPDDELTPQNRVGREVLRGLLDELTQDSGGLVQVRFFDPASDRELRDRAVRLGIRPARISDQSDRAFSLREFWQGMRLRYGGEKQKVIPQLAPRIIPALYEAELTPIIKALAQDDKPGVGVIAYPSPPPKGPQGQTAPPLGFGALFGADKIVSRYDVQRLEWDEGQAIPEAIDVLMLVRPRALTDEQKFALDQFLMRGGRLVIFADTDDYEIGEQRRMNRRPQSFDASGSEFAFRDQLAHYGVDIDPDRTVVDLLHQAYTGQFNLLVGGQVGQQVLRVPYPHFLHSLAIDWNSEKARTQLANGESALATTYADRFAAGLDPDHPLSQQFLQSQGPWMFWPAVLDLHRPIPADVEAVAPLRTSPYSLATGLRPSFDPTGGLGTTPQGVDRVRRYAEPFVQQYQSLGPRQFALMVDLRGRFGSYFAGKRVPGAGEDPGRQDASQSGASNGGASNGGASNGGASNDGDDPLKGLPGTDPLAGTDRESQDVPLPEDPEVLPEPELEVLERAPESARLVVLADSDFIRDDLLLQQYRQVGGPVSLLGGGFVLAMLDWIVEDDDLVALRSRNLVDRGLQLVEETGIEVEEPWRMVERVQLAQARLRWIYMVLGPAILLLIGLVVWLRRTAAKRAFLASVA